MLETHRDASWNQLFFEKRANISALTFRDPNSPIVGFDPWCASSEQKKKSLRQFRTVISRNQISGCARIVNSRYKHRWNGGSCAPYRDPPEGRRNIERGFVWKQKGYTCNERRSVRVPYLAISSRSIDRLWAFATIWIRNSPIYGLFLQLRQHAQNRERPMMNLSRSRCHNAMYASQEC